MKTLFPFAGVLVALAAVALGHGQGAIKSKGLVKGVAPVLPSGRNTPFDPKRDGFQFSNTFKNDFIPAFDVRTGGLCGGMVYTALDYYNAKFPIPRQDYRPADKTALHDYIYDRQTHSLLNNVDKWGEVILNPGGARNTEFFNWGLQGSNGGRIQELKSFIDRGVPVPLGLKGDTAGDHQVLAIGYDMGRYKGDLGAYKEDFKIKVYDPNYPNEIKTLVPFVAQQVYGYKESPNRAWRTYFVDRNYSPKAPPRLANPVFPNDGTVRELIMAFETGGDDLRGGNDNVNVQLNLFDGSQQTYNNVNLGARWFVNYTQYARVILTRPVSPDKIRNAIISTTFRGGIDGDNWDMKSLEIRALGGGLDRILGRSGFKRFTGDSKQIVVPINNAPATPLGSANQLVLSIQTGNDDLRGGNDNVNVIVRYKNGQTQFVGNVNDAKRWADGTTHSVTISLNKVVPPSEIAGITLQTTFGGGLGGDNWNMQSIQIRAVGNAVNKTVGSFGFKRFTGDDKSLAINFAG